MPENDFKIDIRLDPDRLARWHVHVVEALARDPHHSVRVAVGKAPDWPRGAAALFRLERTLFGTPADDPLTTADWSALHVPPSSRPADLRVDLAGDSETDETPTFRILADGAPLEAGALSAVLDKRVPLLQAVRSEGADRLVVGSARPATENPRFAYAAVGMIIGRAADMLLQAIPPSGAPAMEAPVSMPAATASPARFFAAALASRIDARIRRMLGQAPNWFVALRSSVAAGLPDIGPAGFARVADDGARFYADPFLWESGGQRLLFVEELPFATGKGIISVATIDGSGRPGRPLPVLETDCHLSYPFLFAHDGAIWMIPETSARRTVELYRADPFPDRWTLHSVLIEDADLGDATLHEIDGTWWVFAASRARWASSWDSLSLYHARSPFGPWTAHRQNPVLVDVRSARPAGNLLTVDGRLVRPVQDSAAGYGAALGFAAIDTLSPNEYRQMLIKRVAPWGANRGLHTYNRSASLEAIDLFGPRPSFNPPLAGGSKPRSGFGEGF